MNGDDAWTAANQRHLVAHLARLRARLEGRDSPEPPWQESGRPPALEEIRAAFGLSAFERDLLLLAAGVQLDAGFRRAVAEADPTVGHPTFGMALAVLDGAAWDALTPSAPLRYWRLLDVHGGDLTGGPLVADEAVVHALVGVPTADARLDGLLHPDQGPAEPGQPASTVLAGLRSGQASVAQLVGPDRRRACAVARAVAEGLGGGSRLLHAGDLPADAGDREWARRLVSRQTLLLGALPVLVVDAEAGSAAERFVDAMTTPALVVTPDPLTLTRPALVVEVANRPATDEQWRSRLGDLVPEGELQQARAQFPLPAADLPAVEARVRAGERVWQACRAQGRQELSGLAHRVVPRAAWEQLVVPESVEATLRAFTAQVRNRTVVYDEWGWGSRLRGRGISALFAGPSGTGKTLAAEVIAADLQVDLYVVDLSAVVSKYIGETEKNLRRVFDAAEGSGAILLFDEADALFGKRSEVRDSHDRYANLEVSYLLQRMERHNGATILTSNQKDALDPAFARRLRFTVTFPFPDAGLRAEVWRRVVPRQTPSEDLPLARLAQVSLSGGQISRTALNAAFSAADAGAQLGVRHLGEALQRDGEISGAQGLRSEQ